MKLGKYEIWKRVARACGFLAGGILVGGFALAAEPSESGSGKKPALVSEAVAQVSDHVITSREVFASYIIDQALSEKRPQKKSKLDRSRWILKFPSEAFQEHLGQVVLEAVVQLEAENFSIGQNSQSEIQSYEEHLEEMVKQWEPWRKLEISKVEINKMISRKIKAKHFLLFKKETSGIQISDEEAKAYFDKFRVKFGNQPFSDIKDQIKDFLSQEQLQEKLKDFYENLRRKYRVKLLGQSGKLGQ